MSKAWPLPALLSWAACWALFLGAGALGAPLVLALALGAAHRLRLALPLRSRAPCRHLGGRLVAVRAGLSVPAPREHDARCRQGDARAAARRLAREPGVRRDGPGREQGARVRRRPARLALPGAAAAASLSSARL